jgi:hypothetical protein
VGDAALDEGGGDAVAGEQVRADRAGGRAEQLGVADVEDRPEGAHPLAGVAPEDDVAVLARGAHQ